MESHKTLKTCSTNRFTCSRKCYKGYSYCFKHILEDPNSPCAMCKFVSKVTGRRCHNPVLKAERCTSVGALMCMLHRTKRIQNSTPCILLHFMHCYIWG